MGACVGKAINPVAEAKVQYFTNKRNSSSSIKDLKNLVVVQDQETIEAEFVASPTEYKQHVRKNTIAVPITSDSLPNMVPPSSNYSCLYNPVTPSIAASLINHHLYEFNVNLESPQASSRTKARYHKWIT